MNKVLIFDIITGFVAFVSLICWSYCPSRLSSYVFAFSFIACIGHLLYLGFKKMGDSWGENSDVK